jgi:hypothetical protein
LGINNDDPVALPASILSIFNRERDLNDPFKCTDALQHSHLAFVVRTEQPPPDFTVFPVAKSLIYKEPGYTYFYMSGSVFEWFLVTIIGSGSTNSYDVRQTANLIHAYLLRTGLRKLYGDCTRQPLADGTYTIERS